MAWHDAAAADAVIEGEPLGVTIAGLPVALFGLDGAIFALHDLCSHGQARLSDGFVEDGCVEVPAAPGPGRHPVAGAPRSEPITIPVRRFPARIRDGRVEIEI